MPLPIGEQWCQQCPVPGACPAERQWQRSRRSERGEPARISGTTNRSCTRTAQRRALRRVCRAVHYVCAAHDDHTNTLSAPSARDKSITPRHSCFVRCRCRTHSRWQCKTIQDSGYTKGKQQTCSNQPFAMIARTHRIIVIARMSADDGATAAATVANENETKSKKQKAAERRNARDKRKRRLRAVNARKREIKRVRAIDARCIELEEQRYRNYEKKDAQKAIRRFLARFKRTEAQQQKPTKKRKRTQC